MTTPPLCPNFLSADKIVVGSLSGVLAIFRPSGREQQPDDQLLEVQLDHPVLQLELGFFHSPRQLSLAVLHPRSVVVYELQGGGATEAGVGASAGGGAGEGGGGALYYSLGKLFEHALERPAHSMVHGPFGGVQGWDLICVQSMDGLLTITERETVAFQRVLPNFVVPGPLCYIPATDSLLTCNSAFELECYSYQVLAAASSATAHSRGGGGSLPSLGGAGGEREGDKDLRTGGTKLTQVKKLQADWRFTLGERALEISSAVFTKTLHATEVDLIIMGEHSLFVLSQNGALKSNRQLEFLPMACCVNTLPAREGSRSAQNLLVATHTGSLMVYQDTKLMWAAKHDIVPIAVRVGTFNRLPGLVVCLSDEGALMVTYMGTNPNTEVASPQEVKDLDYEAMDEEHRNILAKIRASTKQTRVEPTDRLVLRIQTPQRLDGVGSTETPVQSRRSSFAGGEPYVMTIRVFASYQGTGAAENVHLQVVTPSSMIAEPSTIEQPYLDGNARTPLVWNVVVISTPDHLPSSQDIEVVATYTAASGEFRTQSCCTRAPLCLFGSVIQPVKTASYRVTLESNYPPPQLRALFEDVILQSAFSDELMAQGSSANNVVSFRFLSGEECTVLVSKAAGRYRLQSEHFHALWMLAVELCSRLETYFASGAQNGPEPFRISFEEPLPLLEFFSLVDQHFNCRQACRNLSAQLEAQAHQFRATQKRLLIRYRDRNPTDLSHLDKLLEATLEQMNLLSEEIEAAQRDLVRLGGELGGACRLVNLLLKHKHNMNEAQYNSLCQTLSPQVTHNVERGWEEHTEAVVSHMLRTALAKGGPREASTSPQVVPAMTDTTKFKKHISLLCDRLSKGASL